MTTTGVSSNEASLTLTSGMSVVVPIIALVAVAGLAAAVLIMKRRRKGGEGGEQAPPQGSP